jgi:hypothetical protein
LVTKERWNALVNIVEGQRKTLADYWVTIEEHDKKLKRLVAISLRPDFQKMFPWDSNNTTASNPDDAAARAAQFAAKVRAQQAKRNEKPDTADK